MEAIAHNKDELETLAYSMSESDEYVQITEQLSCGKLKWLPIHIERRKAVRKKEGFELVEDGERRIFELPGLLYGVILVFRKKKQ